MRADKIYHVLLSIFIVVVGVGPVVLNTLGIAGLDANALSAINLLACSIILLLLFARWNHKEVLSKKAESLGIETALKSSERLLKDLLYQIERKNQSLSINLAQKKISTAEELTSALEKIVSKAYVLLKANSAELALFDEESGLYHSALLLGKPFQSSAQAMLVDASEREEKISHDVLVQPISFAGTTLGTLRIALSNSRVPSMADKEIVNLLALQAGLALMNAEYSKQLIKMRQSSDQSTKARTGFLANLSHEIRGPLGIMLNAVELILDGICGEITAEQTRTLGMIQSNGKHLLELINDVLDYSKVESGKLFPKKIEIPIDAMLKDVTTIIRSQAIEKGHKLNYKAPEEDCAIICDKRHFRQMMINLLTNAVKYTPERGVIEVWTERIPGNRIRINVQDSGVGISPEDRIKVFSPFERIEDSYSINQVGTGLGMPLTKRLAEVNDGHIDFDSEVGKGSHFWLTFPATALTFKHEEKDEKKEVIEGRNNLVLLVEKDDGEREMVHKYLSNLGFNVNAVSDKLEAIEFLKSSEVDIVILDNKVTDNQNESFISWVREGTSSQLPVILISSRAFVADIKQYLREGIDRCLTKPVKLHDLAKTVRFLIDESKKSEERKGKISAEEEGGSKKFPSIKTNDSEIAH